MCLAIAKPANLLVPEDYLKTAFRANSDGAGFAYHKDGRVHIVKGFMQYEKFIEAWRPFAKLAALIHFRYTTHGATNHANCHPFELDDGALIHNGIISGMGDSRYGYNYSVKSAPKKRPIDKNSTFSEKFEAAIDVLCEALGLKGKGKRRRAAALVNQHIDIEVTPNKDGLRRYDGKVAALDKLLAEYAWAVNDKEQHEDYSRSDTREFVEDWLKGWDENMLMRGRRFIEHRIGSGSKLATLHNSGRILLFNEHQGHWNDGVWYSNSCYRANYSTYSGHIPTAANPQVSSVGVASLEAARQAYHRNGPVTTYVPKEPGSKEMVKVTELRPTKDDNKKAFLDTMIDGLQELDEDPEPNVIRAEDLFDYPTLHALGFHGD